MNKEKLIEAISIFAFRWLCTIWKIDTCSNVLGSHPHSFQQDYKSSWLWTFSMLMGAVEARVIYNAVLLRLATRVLQGKCFNEN